jgi:hypothetical protein
LGIESPVGVVPFFFLLRSSEATFPRCSKRLDRTSLQVDKPDTGVLGRKRRMAGRGVETFLCLLLMAAVCPQPSPRSGTLPRPLRGEDRMLHSRGRANAGTRREAGCQV